MIIGYEPYHVNLYNLTSDCASASVKGNLIGSQGPIENMWAYDVDVTLPITDKRIASLLAAVRAYLLPVESEQWPELGIVADIAIYHMDAVKNRHRFGVAVSYHRFKEDGSLIPGFDGRQLFEIKEGRWDWHGAHGSEKARKQRDGFEPLAQSVVDLGRELAIERLREIGMLEGD